MTEEDPSPERKPWSASHEGARAEGVYTQTVNLITSMYTVEFEGALTVPAGGGTYAVMVFDLGRNEDQDWEIASVSGGDAPQDFRDRSETIFLINVIGKTVSARVGDAPRVTIRNVTDSTSGEPFQFPRVSDPGVVLGLDDE